MAVFAFLPKFLNISARLLLSVALILMASLTSAQTVLITGANSGIGLEMSRQYAELGWHVIATHRRDVTPDTLVELSSQHDNVQVEKMDVTSLEQIQALAGKLEVVPIDVLINNAGVFALGDWMDATDTSQQFGTLNYEQFDIFMRTNVRGPAMVTEAFVEHVRASSQKKVITITSTVGTISTPQMAVTAFWYGTSKAALNKLTVTMAEALRSDNIIVVPLHPGAVRVEKQAERDFPGMMDPPEAVEHIISTIDSLDMSYSGRFTNYDGTELPW